MSNFYNDVDEKSCAWMRQLIEDKLIPEGDVICKSITDIQPDELKGYNQHHFFSGIAGWPHALDLAGWPRARPIWTASLPCQSFSLAGNGGGFDDPRGQLWYPFLELVKVHKPMLIAGEQVEAAIGKGWLDRVFSDLEAEGYTCGAVVLGAHSVGAPHRRQRIYWVASLADAKDPEHNGRVDSRRGFGGPPDSGRLGDPRLMRCDEGISGDGRGQAGARSQPRPVVDRPGQPDLVAYCEQQGLEGHAGHGDGGDEPRREQADTNGSASESGSDGIVAHPNGWKPSNRVIQRGREQRLKLENGQDNFWDDYDIIHFTDGAKRRIKPGIELMVASVPKGVVRGGDQSAPINPEATAEARRMRLHGYGNALTIPVAVAFIQTVMDVFDIYETPVQIKAG